MTRLNYNEDKVWNEAKKVAKMNGFSNQWIEIIDYYNSRGGAHVQIFVVIDSEKHRILYLLDSEQVLLSNKLDKAVIRDYQEINESKKLFFYKEETTPMEFELPENEYYIGSKKVTTNV